MADADAVASATSEEHWLVSSSWRRKLAHRTLHKGGRHSRSLALSRSSGVLAEGGTVEARAWRRSSMGGQRMSWSMARRCSWRAAREVVVTIDGDDGDGALAAQ